ncbi:hypothetical protein [Brevundimonas goettingensis]|uniref:Uncharacterized protein n=1 Tax=Brevundimonas goettingensis TaxID=2774190 RepID=A0A975GX44_9CAUL|nr:hypothetical protein [Brevundimonas goettingensis]QTC90145.1 hypothetical protein IFJ75_12730 [Brevundimonas goettingensis]
MTATAPIAHSLMALAAALTPASRAEWSLAMRKEFDALPDASGALGWAAGCVATAFGWRMRAEAGFALTVTATVVVGWWVSAQIFFFLVEWLSPKGISWMPAMAAAENLLRGGVCFGLAFVWPRRAALTGLALPMVWGFGAVPLWLILTLPDTLSQPWSSAGNHPALPNILFPLIFVGREMWASLLGAALGWGLSRILRSRPVAAPA